MSRKGREFAGSASKPNIVVLIPAYNEERFIGSVVLKVRRFADTVLVVDDGSKDSTRQIARDAGALVIRHKVNRGKSEALNTGFRKCRSMKPDAVITMDGDAQHRPEDIPTLLAPILAGEAEVVIGSRYMKKTSRVPWQRIFGHYLTTSLTNLSSGVRVSDSQSGFRAFSGRALRELIFQSGGFSVESEMQFLIHESHLKVMEVPITIQYQDKPKRSAIGQGLSVLNGILNMIGLHRPFLFFSLPGIVIVLVGVIWGVWVVNIYRQFQVLAIGYALISVALIIVGSLSTFTGIILHALRGQLMEFKDTSHR